MDLKFYYAPMSTASATAAVIAELGISCEHIKLDIQAGDTKRPEFLKINPNGLVPVIIHEGTVIWESAAIVMYLGETFGVDAKLYPQAGPLRGEAMKWITWTNVTLAEAGSRLAFSMKPGGEVAAAKARADLSKGLKIIDSALATKPFLLGVSGRSSRPVKIRASSDGGGMTALSGFSTVKLPLLPSSAAIADVVVSNRAAASATKRIITFPIASHIRL